MVRLRHCALSALLLIGCGDADAGSQGGSASGGADANGGQGGETSVASGGSGGASSSGTGGAAASSLEQLLQRLRADLSGTLLAESQNGGWPVLVDEGYVVVSTSGQPQIAGGFSSWQPLALTPDQGFSFTVIVPGDLTEDRGYKFTDGMSFVSDDWSRSFAYDEFGELSLIHPQGGRFDRFFGVQSSEIEPRKVTVLVPEQAPSHLLYLHDGQNLFAPSANFGGWRLQDSVPAGMMLVGIDNSPARMDEYTHVADVLSGNSTGGEGDAYVAFLESEVRSLIASVYGEPGRIGVMGSSLGGLISLHAGFQFPASYDFVGSLSGTVGWGSFGPHTGETMIERYGESPTFPFVVYLDSGGDGPCDDADGDGIFDDGDGTDNYCENAQLRDALAMNGYVFGENLHHWHEPGAPHNEAAWAERVFRPLQIFAAL
jgi:predicted alpha/beta superfamily hydrolase